MYKIVAFIFVYLTCILTNRIWAQENVVPLEQQYRNAKIGTATRFEAAADYIKFLFFNNQKEKAFEILKVETNLATKLHDGKFAATLYTISSILNLLDDNLHTSQEASRTAIHYANKTTDAETKGYVAYGQGWTNARTEKENQAVKSFLEALSYYEKAKPSKNLFQRKLSVFTELSSIYANWQEYNLQEKYTLAALQLANKENDPNSIFNANMAMGFLREQQYNLSIQDKKILKEAEKYYLKALETFESNRSKMSIPSDLSYVANNLAHLYLNYFPEQNEALVQKYADLAIQQGKLTEQHQHVASANGILADLYLKKGNAEKAKSHLLAAIAELEQNNIEAPLTKMNVLERLSEIHEQEGNYREALRYHKTYLNLFQSFFDQEKSTQAKKIEAQYQQDKHNQELLSLQLEGQKKEKRILEMNLLNLQQVQQLEKFKLLQDNQQKEIELAALEKLKQEQELKLSKLESFNKQQEIELYKSEISHKERINLFYIGIAVVVSLLLLAFIYAYIQRSKSLRQQQSIYALELEKERQNSKISNLTTMLDAQERERGRLARDLHDGLGGLLSGAKMNLSLLKDSQTALSNDNITHSISKLDLAVDELRRVAHNLMPDLLEKYGLQEALTDYASRMSNSSLDIDVQFLHYEDNLPKSQQLLVYRIIQELVNNVIKHAEASQIIIQLIEYDTHYQVVVEDDGKGFDLQNKLSKSAGLHNIQSRIEFLKGKVSIDSQPDLGTSIDIQFPKTNTHD
ncbi:tetratricopeptide repeat-containing sensor histidine kinase [Sphingobacterium composti Ten et al. 2007 non Yoo et al. 2007]|uniref:tetratricopeptide repeat-containing sensor histidine kinase n=1 Tax=Sphingobacterium composti TaxID=363260 RepID=UPI00135AC37B|nr:sensor histidine kinase [Sphingobacterium composti Ten et al. 2007 non Yoo et al. 2007]